MYYSRSHDSSPTPPLSPGDWEEDEMEDTTGDALACSPSSLQPLSSGRGGPGRGPQPPREISGSSFFRRRSSLPEDEVGA